MLSYLYPFIPSHLLIPLNLPLVLHPGGEFSTGRVIQLVLQTLELDDAIVNGSKLGQQVVR